MKLYVCSGKHCCKKRAGVDALCETLGKRVEAVDVRCQKICRGPVVGLKLDGSLEWFKEVDSIKSLKALAKVVEGKKLKKSLRKRHVPKRSGALRT